MQAMTSRSLTSERSSAMPWRNPRRERDVTTTLSPALHAEAVQRHALDHAVQQHHERPQSWQQGQISKSAALAYCELQWQCGVTPWTTITMLCKVNRSALISCSSIKFPMVQCIMLTLMHCKL